MPDQKVTLSGGPRAGDEIRLTAFPEVLRVPVEVEVEDEGLERYPTPPTKLLVAWYRRDPRNQYSYHFDCYERER